jgi:hypothetical protein
MDDFVFYPDDLESWELRQLDEDYCLEKMENQGRKSLTACLELLRQVLPTLLGNPSLLTVDQVVELRQMLAEGYAAIDDYFYRHLD